MLSTIGNLTHVLLQEIEQYTPEEMKVGLHVLFRYYKKFYMPPIFRGLLGLNLSGSSVCESCSRAEQPLEAPV